MAASAEEGREGVPQPALAVNTEDHPVAVETGAGMRNAEFEHVADGKVAALGNREEGVLVVEPRYGRQAGRQRQRAPVAVDADDDRQILIEGYVAHAHAPGVIETDMTENVIRERGEAIRSQTPLRRIGQPDDIADFVAFLASEEGGWISGRTIRADGGML